MGKGPDATYEGELGFGSLCGVLNHTPTIYMYNAGHGCYMHARMFSRLRPLSFRVKTIAIYYVASRIINVTQITVDIFLVNTAYYSYSFVNTSKPCLFSLVLLTDFSSGLHSQIWPR